MSNRETNPYTRLGIQTGILPVAMQSRVSVGRVLITLGKGLFVTAGLSFWVGGEVYRRTVPTDRLEGEFVGIGIAILCIASAIVLYSIGEKLQSVRQHQPNSEITRLNLTD